MKVRKQDGGDVVVEISAKEVREFMSRYPSSGLCGHARVVVFDQKGDIVDHDFEEHENGDGLRALLEDMVRQSRQ